MTFYETLNYAAREAATFNKYFAGWTLHTHWKWMKPPERSSK